jgi:hypothetical protein
MNNDDKKIESLLKRYIPADPPAQLKDRIFKPQPKPRSLPWLPIAAGIFVVLSAGLIWQIISSPANSPAQTENQPTFAELERQINRAGSAAGLLTIADMFAQQPGAEEYAKNRYSYLIENYPDQQASTIAKARLQSLTERTVIQ